MRTALAKLSKMSSLLHTSTSFRELFDKKFNDDGGNRGIPQPVVTRWNSSLRQIAALLKLEQVPTNSFLSHNNYHNLIFSNKEWNQLQELEKLLKPFAEATDQTQGEKVSYSFPCYLHKHTCFEEYMCGVV